MNLKLAGILAALALGGVAFAQAPEHPGESQAGITGNMPVKGEHVITARVLGVSGKTLFIDSDNLAVALEVTDKTTIDGKTYSGKQLESELRKTFKEGDQVRAGFELKKESREKLENEALRLDKNPGPQNWEKKP